MIVSRKRQRGIGYLTWKQKLFIDEYIMSGMDAPKAYLKAGYRGKNKNSIAAGASQLMANKAVERGIRRRYSELRKGKKGDKTQNDIIKEMQRISFSDVRKVFHEDNTLKKVYELDDATAAAVAGVDISTSPLGITTTKFRFWDKIRPLELLGKCYGLFTERIEHTIRGGVLVVPAQLSPDEYERAAIKHHQKLLNGGNGDGEDIIDIEEEEEEDGA